MDELRRHHLTKRLEAVKKLRESPTDVEGAGLTIGEIVDKWTLSGLFLTGCPRCGSSFYWTPPFGEETKGRVCCECLLVVT